jgi:GTPase SAR1 family protein
MTFFLISAPNLGYGGARTLPNDYPELLPIRQWCNNRFAKNLHSKVCCKKKTFLFLVYDITKRSSFLSIQRWIEEVRRYTASSVILALVGNKSDMDGLREVEFSEAESMCEYIPEVLFVMETSAKENKNIEDIFIGLATELKVKRRNAQSIKKISFD